MTTETRIIENYLLIVEGWTPARSLCEELQIDERDLRAGGIHDISSFTISCNSGYKHCKRCTNEEFIHFTNRIRAHATAELERVIILERNRDAVGQMEMSL